MRNILFLVTLIIFLSPSGISQGYVYIPADTPSSGGCNMIPFNWPSTATVKSCRYQMILSGRFLPTAPIRIYDISFAPCKTSPLPRSWSSRKFLVRMCHTTMNDFSGNNCFDKNLCRCATVLHDGPIQWQINPENWSPFNLAGSFGYDGRRNILLDIEALTNSGGISCHGDRTTAIPRLWSNQVPPEACGSEDTAGLKIRLTYARTCILQVPETASLGTSTPVHMLQAPTGKFYQMAASLGQWPPIDLVACKVCLAIDPVLVYSILVGPPIFTYYAGVINPTGTADGKFVPPVIKELAGLCVFHAAVAYDTKAGVLCCTNTCGTLLVP